MKQSVFFLFALICWISEPVLGEEYTLSMLPNVPSEQLTAMLTPLAAKLSTETGNTIKAVLTNNPDQYEAELLRGNIVIGYQNPLVYVNVSKMHEVLATAVQGKNGSLLMGIIISRPEAGISGITDLKGKKIMIVGKNSAGGFLSQKKTLRENGINVEWDCQLSEAADNREENVLISVSVGEVDAGFISESSLHKADEYIAPGSIITVMKTAPLPNWALSVSRSMPQGQKDDLKAVLVQMTKDEPAIKTLGISAFKAADDADYDLIRSLVE